MKKIIFAFFLIILRSDIVKSDYFDCFETPDYDYTYEYPEVIYLPPERVNNIVDFLKKLAANSTAPVIPYPKQKNTEATPREETTRHIEEITTTTAATTTTTSAETTTPTTEATTTSVETTTTSVQTTTTSTELPTLSTKVTITPTEVAVTIKTDENPEVEDPIEDVNDNGLIEREKVPNTPEANENLDMNYDDNYYERDSQEDILSSKKKPEKIRESTQSTPEDENDSKPKNVYRWLSL
ncbi:coiled-coil domain-containing protein 80-like [Coccinella septempunctata]|uniref:coiled-coil domain-containing protein 80-like n=1 Tax=Coccinella septempunctata TaxID=41139 RepID=UPI001D07D2A6|nr:coiled-coil domain-containing protein 80-like [Coccinella septempunctata]